MRSANAEDEAHVVLDEEHASRRRGSGADDAEHLAALAAGMPAAGSSSSRMRGRVASASAISTTRWRP
jgi:hypothetical protein